MKVSMMKIKLMTITLMAVLGIVAAPLALEHLNNLKVSAERWAKNNLLSSGIVTVHANEQEQPATFSVANLAQSSTDEFHWTGRVTQGQAIEIKGINGDVRAEPSTGNEVEVTAIKLGRRSNPKEVEIRVLQHGGGVTICAVYPSNDPNRPNGC